MRIDIIVLLLDKLRTRLYYTILLKISSHMTGTIIFKQALSELRKYWLAYKPKEWLFPGKTQDRHLGYTAAREAFYKAKKKPVYKEVMDSTF